MLKKLLSIFKPRASSGGALGKKGEELAGEFLEKKGYRIMERNFRVKGGEADIIAAFHGRTVVVEVKTRSSARFGPPQAAVNKRKFNRLRLAGTIFCRMKKLPVSLLRVDVVAIDTGGGEPSISHFENINLSG